MSAGEWIGIGVTLLLMLVGVVGSVLPGLPGPPVVLLAAIGHKLWFGEASASVTVLVVMALLMIASLALDFVAGVVGARKLGATWRGMAGALIGATIGIFLGPVALVAGPFVGAVLFELAGGRRLEEAGRAGIGAVLGLLAGVVGKLACAVAMTGLFVVSVVVNS